MRNGLLVGAALAATTVTAPSEGFIMDIGGTPYSSSPRTTIEPGDGAFQIVTAAREAMAVCDEKLAYHDREGTIADAGMQISIEPNVSNDLAQCISDATETVQRELNAIGSKCAIGAAMIDDNQIGIAAQCDPNAVTNR